MVDILRSTSDGNREISIIFGHISGPWSERYCLSRRVRPPVATHDGNEHALGAVLFKRQLELALCVIYSYNLNYSYSYSYSYSTNLTTLLPLGT